MFLVSVLCKAGRGVITNDRVEGRDQHQGLGEMAGDTVMISGDSTDTMVSEGRADITEESRGLQHGVYHYRLEYVEFKLTTATGDTHCDMVTHHLGSHHRHCLTLRRIHLTCNNQRLILLH